MVGLAVAAPHAIAVGDQLAGIGVRVCEGPEELLQNAMNLLNSLIAQLGQFLNPLPVPFILIQLLYTRDVL